MNLIYIQKAIKYSFKYMSSIFLEGPNLKQVTVYVQLLFVKYQLHELIPFSMPINLRNTALNIKLL